MPRLDRTVLVRLIFWPAAIILGALVTWAGRYSIVSDGISYVDIGEAYFHGDWGHAFNAYWSPLFSWMIAAAFLILHPSAYWEVFVVHLVGFLSYLAVLVAFEFFMKELISGQQNQIREPGFLPIPILYVAGYCSVIFLALGLEVNIGSVSPDALAMALMLFLLTLVLYIRRVGGSNAVFVLFGIMGALCYFAKEALIGIVAVCLCVILISRYKQQRDIFRPAAIVILSSVLLTAPFVAAISRKEGKFTIGESARLNYAWEVCGAHRWVHWQGEPFDIGTPKHPTLQVVSSPKTFVFAGPVAGTYPPWYDPSYWYAGIRPKLKLRPQLRVILVNLSVAIGLLVKSPILFAACVLILLTGIRSWWRRLIELWAILVPVITGIGLYCFVYIERRYIGANLLILWMAMLVAIRLETQWLKVWGPRLIAFCAVAFLAIWAGYRHASDVKSSFVDLVHGREEVWNVNYLLAQRFRELGLNCGDKIAYVGPGINAEWARLDGVRIVAEVPLMYSRAERLFNNSEIDDTRQIRAFWTADPLTRQRVLQAFRDAGAKVVVTDGYFYGRFVSQWPRALSSNQQHLPKLLPDSSFSQLNTRYFPLVPLNTKSDSSHCPSLTARR